MGSKKDVKLLFIGARTFFTWENLLGYTVNAWIMTSEFNKVVSRKNYKISHVLITLEVTEMAYCI